MNWLFRNLAFVVLVVTGVASVAPVVTAAILYTNNAENGAGGLVDQTNAGYPLIQSSVVGQGASAFHLAHPAAPTDEWFEISQTITPQADTKLFFLSRLGTATASQVAKVQISTNGGSTWPTTLYQQAGSGQPGEGGFSLKQIDLGNRVGQNLRFRFMYDFTGGSYFPQTTAGVGWYVDDIQIADQFQKIQYSIGAPTEYEQQYLEYINRARKNASAEATRLAAISDPDITSAYASFNVTPANIVSQFTASINQGIIDQTAQPLSFNAKLNQSADLHTQDMRDRQFQGHESSTTPPAPFLPGYTLSQRLAAVGYGFVNAGENVFSNAKTVAHGHAGFDIDWGNTTNPADPNYRAAFAGQGMQNPAGHRITIHNNDYKEIGIGVFNGSNGTVGPQLVTQDFGNPGSVSFVTGVVFQDLNANSFYDIGEGRGGVRIDVDGSPFFALSATSGGYSVPVSGDGSYGVTFSGGGFATYLTTANIAGGLNFKVDYLASTVANYAADFNNDNKVTGADLIEWRGDYGVNAVSTADADSDSDGADFLVWQRQVGLGNVVAASNAVPEPQTAMLAALALFLAGWRIRKNR